MKEIQLNTVQSTSKNYLKHKAFVDDEDYNFLMQWKWSYHKMGNSEYADRLDRDSKKTILMHRAIIATTQDKLIDHKDGNGLNNQRSNLRVCTRTENNANRKSAKNSSSKYLGVQLEKRGWTARIRKDGAGKRLGTFNTELDAAHAYNVAAKEIHGEFANLNLI